MGGEHNPPLLKKVAEFQVLANKFLGMGGGREVSVQPFYISHRDKSSWLFSSQTPILHVKGS